MIEPLGNTSQSLRTLARRAATIISARGECAVFLSLQTRAAYALTRTDPDWKSATQRHTEHLVGIYQTVVGDKRLASWILEDMKAHERSATPARAA